MKELIFRVNQRLLFWVLLGVILYYGRTFLVPLAFAIMLAMLMAPLSARLDRSMNRALSSLVCVFIVCVVLLIMLGVIAGQFAAFSRDMPQIKGKAEEVFSDAQSWVEDQFKVSEQKQKEWLRSQLQSVGKTAGGFLRNLVGGVAAIGTGLVLALVYTYLLIYQREKYAAFFLKIFAKHGDAETEQVIQKVSHVAQKYLLGRVISILILIFLYALGLLAAGVKYAVLLAAVAGLLAFLPYIGTVVGGLFPVLMAFVTQDARTALWAGVVLAAIQVIDNYFIEPYVVGGEVNLSALATILAIISGGLIWGAAGMILFIPLLGIARIIFDHVENLEPYSHLIGDSGPETSSKIKDWAKKLLGKK